MSEKVTPVSASVSREELQIMLTDLGRWTELDYQEFTFLVKSHIALLDSHEQTIKQCSELEKANKVLTWAIGKKDAQILEFSDTLASSGGSQEQAVPVSGPGQWRPIETAPKDGWFWLWLGWRGACVGRHSVDSEYEWEFIEHEKAGGLSYLLNACKGEATRWQPMPDPPTAGVLPETAPASAPHTQRDANTKADLTIKAADALAECLQLAQHYVNGSSVQSEALRNRCGAALAQYKAAKEKL